MNSTMIFSEFSILQNLCFDSRYSSKNYLVFPIFWIHFSVWWDGFFKDVFGSINLTESLLGFDVLFKELFGIADLLECQERYVGFQVDSWHRKETRSTHIEGSERKREKWIKINCKQAECWIVSKRSSPTCKLEIGDTKIK